MYSYKRRDASAVDGHGRRARRVCLAERRSEATFVAGWASRQAQAALVRLSNIRLRYVKKTPYLPFLGRSSVGRSHAPSSLISLLFCSAWRRLQKVLSPSSLHYDCPPHFYTTSSTLCSTEAVLVDGVVSSSLAPLLDPPPSLPPPIHPLPASASVLPSISFPSLLHRLIRPIFLPLTMGSLSATPGGVGLPTS